MDEIRLFLSEELNIAIDNCLRLKGEIRAIELDIEFMDKACSRLLNNKDATGDIFQSIYNNNTFDDMEVSKLKSRKEELMCILSGKKHEYKEAEERCERIKKISAIANNGELNEETFLFGEEAPKGFGYELMSMQDVDRRRIAMGIHDTVVQNLTAVIMKNDFIIKLLNSDVQRAKLELSGVSNILKESINELRDIIYDLRPMSLEDLGFEDAFNNLINKFRARTNMEFVTKYEADINDADTVILSNLLRIIRELCTNSVKHSKGTLITVSIKSDKKNITMSIEDNGVGFDFDEKSELNRTTNFGLSMVTDRVKYLNGKISAKRLQKGMRFKVIIPREIIKEVAKDD